MSLEIDTVSDKIPGLVDGAEYSPLLADDEWGVNDSTFLRYAERVACASGGYPEDVIDGLKQRFGTGGDHSVLDVAGGSNGRAVQDLLELGVMRNGLVTNFQDFRSSATRSVVELGHVSGNLSDVTTWKSIRAWRDRHAPDGFSLTTFFPVAALHEFSTRFYLNRLGELLDMAMPGGLLLLTVPEPVQNLMSEESYMCTLDQKPAVAKVEFAPRLSFTQCKPYYVTIEKA